MLESLQRLPISFGMALRTKEKCKKVAEELVKKGDYTSRCISMLTRGEGVISRLPVVSDV
jgi:hypothetical protein